MDEQTKLYVSRLYGDFPFFLEELIRAVEATLFAAYRAEDAAAGLVRYCRLTDPGLLLVSGRRSRVPLPS